MAIDEADSSDAGQLDTGQSEEAEGYSWVEFYAEHGDSEDADALRQAAVDGTVTRETFDRAGVDPSEYLGFDPAGTESVLSAASHNAAHIAEYVQAMQEGKPPVVKGWYSWEDYKREYLYDDEDNPPSDNEGRPEEFDPTSALGFDPELLPGSISHLADRADQLEQVVDERTVDVNEELDEDAFFSTETGVTTIANRYDLEKSVPLEKKHHFREVERYWVNKPFSFVIIFHSVKENEKKYYLIQPHMNEIEDELQEFLTGKLRSSIKYAEEGVAAERRDNRRQVIEDETYELLERYDIYSRPEGEDVFDTVADKLDIDDSGIGGQLLRALGWQGPPRHSDQLEGIEVRPEPAVTAEDPDTLTEYQVEKLLYYLKRDFIGYERIDGIKHDINVEDISCDGYNSPVFVYHSDYEQIISNVYHGEDELDDFVVKLAQRSGKGISKRSPQVDATLPDGSRAQLTLGREVSDHGTNYTIRQFKDVPFTPVDLINWNTFSLEEMAFLWLCIENNKSLIFAGGTASGKTTSLNAVSLFIPSNAKIVSIEDTREVELPQRNWIASVTRPSFAEDDKGDIDEFDLLEAALRQRPDYIVMGEVRGEEGRTLFQVMSTGHTTYTTFHADSVGEVLKRFTTDPINVSKTMFTALDLVSIQTATRVSGNKVRRNKTLTEINRYDAENDEINVQDVYQWQAETDEFLQMSGSNTLEEIKFDRGWDQQRLEDEIFKREAVLAYLIDNGLNTYTQVAATFQAFINDPETILTLMANDGLEESLEDLREMESVLIDIDPEKEEMVPRPDASEEILELTGDILERAEEEVFDQYRGEAAGNIASALMVDEQSDVAAQPGGGEQLQEHTTDADSEPEHGADDTSNVESDTTPDTESDTTPDTELDATPDSDTTFDSEFGSESDASDFEPGTDSGPPDQNGPAGTPDTDEGATADGGESATNDTGNGPDDTGFGESDADFTLGTTGFSDDTDDDVAFIGSDDSEVTEGDDSAQFGTDDETADADDQTSDAGVANGGSPSSGATDVESDATEPADSTDVESDATEPADSTDFDPDATAESDDDADEDTTVDSADQDMTADVAAEDTTTDSAGEDTADDASHDTTEDDATEDSTDEDDPVDTGWDFGDIEGEE